MCFDIQRLSWCVRGHVRLKTSKIFGFLRERQNLRFSNTFSTAFQTLILVPENQSNCLTLHYVPSVYRAGFQMFLNFFVYFLICRPFQHLSGRDSLEPHEIILQWPFFNRKKAAPIFSTLQDPTGLPCKCDHVIRPKRTPQPTAGFSMDIVRGRCRLQSSTVDSLLPVVGLHLLWLTTSLDLLPRLVLRRSSGAFADST